MVPLNLAAVLHGPLDLRIEGWPMPEINGTEVLIKMECVGICGTDLNIYKYTRGRSNQAALPDPFVLGHEGAGVVVKVGANVSRLKVGDRVSIDPTQPCRGCSFCQGGRYNLCEDPKYCSSSGVSGNMVQYYKHAADFCHKIPDNVSTEEGAVMQPLAVAVHACNRAEIKLGSNVVILGAGPIGVLCAMTARAMGATNILITDIVEGRLEIAKRLGVNHTFLVKKEFLEEEIVKKVFQILGTRPDVTIDACGASSAQRTAMLMTRNGGVVMIIGIGEEMVEMPFRETLLREVDIKGIFRLNNTYPAALAAVSSGAVDLKSLITHRLPLTKTEEALQLAKSGAAMKIIIQLP